eukprot:jgi/Picre1/31654/NNA_007005.t1
MSLQTESIREQERLAVGHRTTYIPKKNKRGHVVYSEGEARMRAISDIVNALVQSITSGKDVNLNTLNKHCQGESRSVAKIGALCRQGGVYSDGGTFMSLPAEYRDYFIRNLHDALSGHSSENVAEAVAFSEQSSTRCIGMTIETRPDFCLTPHLSAMLSYGCTRLEIGLQSTYEDVARDTNRGHTVAAVGECFELSKDAGFKVVAHLMPDLPNVGWERDVESFTEFFENPAFRSDGLKVYPTLVIRGTGLYELWKKGLYKNYEPHKLVDLVARCLALIPPWVRIYRIQRDIPMPLVSSGVEKGNLRELALARCKELGLRCRDVRTREVGIKDIHQKVKPEEVELVRRDYAANGGWETFLAYEDPRQDILVGLLRLRKLAGKQKTRQPQLHGRVSMEAERIAREEHKSTKLAVIAGVGTRHYYRKLGFELDGPYMSKILI